MVVAAISQFNSTSACLIHEYDAFAVMALVQTHKQLEKWNGNSCNRITQDIYLVDIIVLQSLHSGGMVILLSHKKLSHGLNFQPQR